MPAIILAAGDSVRMGYPKALLPIGNGTFLTHILDELISLDLGDCLVVLGRDAPLIRPWIREHQARILINPNPDRGQLSSIQMGLANLELTAPGCLVWPVDHPTVTGSLVRRLLDLFWRTGAPLVLPVFNNRRGHPAIFGRKVFQELLDTPAEQGAKAVVAHHQSTAALLETTEAAIVEDVDTPDDYLKLTGETLTAALARLGMSLPR